MTGKITARVLSYQNTHVKLATAASCNDFQKVYDCCVDLVSNCMYINLMIAGLICDILCFFLYLLVG